SPARSRTRAPRAATTASTTTPRPRAPRSTAATSSRSRWAWGPLGRWCGAWTVAGAGDGRWAGVGHQDPAPHLPATQGDSAKIEADLLYDVNAHARGRALCSQILAHFDEQGHYCLVLEELGRSLYDYLKGNAYAGFPPGHLRAFGRQLLECLAFLKDIKLIHTDLKPENVLVCPGRDVEAAGPGGRRILVPAEPRIKVIDFGGATYDDEHKSSIINTRQYRGPEVTLGLGWSFPSDQWSVGCILAELFSGELFFGTHANNEHLALMEKSLGPFPETVWCNASKEGAKYFDSQGRVRTDEFGKANRRRVAEQLPVAAFAAEGPAGLGPLLAGLLALDPARRLTPEAALAHAFFA
ncbi:unnamed protein product, partial [Heterosigma akashiwo]